jgi:hypothetical protein
MTSPRAVTYEDALDRWLAVMRGDVGGHPSWEDCPMRCGELPQDPAAFDTTSWPAVALPGLAVALTVWVWQHPASRVFPLPRVSNSSRIMGLYHPGNWTVNAAGAQDDTKYLYSHHGIRWDRHGPSRRPTQVRDAWRTTVDADIASKPKNAVSQHADQLSWNEVVALGMAWWIEAHPYSKILPVPHRGTSSCFHPQSWAVNPASAFTESTFRPLRTGHPPKHLSDTPGPPRLEQEPARRQPSDDTPSDPFAEFR